MSVICVCEHSADYHEPACVLDCDCDRFRVEGGLDAAWAEAEAALPEGWWGPSLGPEEAIKKAEAWRAFAWDRPTQRGRLIEGHGTTPAAALRALAEQLREQR